jgi:hypothetical protein
LLVATIHEFNDAYGSFAAGEATYQYVSEEVVSMSVRGNNHSYTHSSLSWMRQNAIKFPSYTLVWTKIEQFIEHSMYVFTITTENVAIENPIISDLRPSLENDNFYGGVVSGVLSEQPKVNVPGELFQIPNIKLYSLGPWMLVYHNDSNVTMYAPKTLISDAALYMAGRARTAENFAILLAHLRFKAKQVNLPSHMLSSSLMAAACLGFVKHLHFETSVLHGVIAPLTDTMEVHAQALKFNFKRVWTWKKVVAACAAAVAVTATVAPTIATSLSITNQALNMLPYVKHLVHKTAYTGLKLSALTAMYKTAFLPYKRYETTDVYDQYRIDRSSYNGASRSLTIPILKLPGTKPVMSIEELSSMELDKTAKMTVPDASLRKETSHIVPGSIVSTHSVPVVIESSAHAVVSGLVQRALKPQPYHSNTFNKATFARFKKLIFEPKNFEALFPGLKEEPVTPLLFTKWNSRFPLAQQKAQAKAWEECQNGNYKPWVELIRKTFIKKECLTKSTEFGVPKLKPRVIQGAGPHLNSKTGPSIAAFAKRLVDMWSVKNKRGPTYVSGASAEEIGAAFQDALHHIADAAILEGDFELFDTTIHREFLELAIEIYVIAGLHHKVLNILEQMIATKGFAPFNIYYEVDGTRHSGDQATSEENTMIQGLCLSFVIYELLHDVAGNESITFVDVLKAVLMLLLGDDNLTIAPLAWIENIEAIKTKLLELGLMFEPVLHTGPNAKFTATFCSSRFWPCTSSEGKEICVLAPKIGRVYAKFGYYDNPPPGMDIRRLARGDALGRRNDCSMLPCIRHLVQRVIDTTTGIEEFHTMSMKKRNANNAHVTEYYTPNNQTYEMSKVLYNIDRATEQEYFNLLQQIKNIPAVCDFTPLRQALVVDGEYETPDLPKLDSNSLHN